MKILLVPEVAERLRKSERFVLDELRRKNLPGSRFGGQWHVTESSIDAYISAHMNVREVRKAKSA